MGRILPVDALQNLEHKQDVLDLRGRLQGVGQGRVQQLSQGGVLQGVPAVGWRGAQGQLR